MKKRFISIVTMMFILASAAAMAATTQPPQVGSTLPEMKLSKPGDSGDLNYLGLSGSGTFSVDQVKAQARDYPDLQHVLSLLPEGCPQCKSPVWIDGKQSQSER